MKECHWKSIESRVISYICSKKTPNGYKCLQMLVQNVNKYKHKKNTFKEEYKYEQPLIT